MGGCGAFGYPGLGGAEVLALACHLKEVVLASAMNHQTLRFVGENVARWFNRAAALARF